MAPSLWATAITWSEGTSRNSAFGSTNFRISQGRLSQPVTIAGWAARSADQWAGILRRLSEIKRENLLLPGHKGAAGNFDQIAMANLFTLGLVEVRNSDRRLALMVSV